MKRALLLAALTAITAPVAAKAVPLFTIEQTTPSIIQFEGTGTAQFNSSKGTNNQFNVGSSTNLGVSASLSSTPEIVPTANANLDLAQGSQLQQTIGSSSNAANTLAMQSASYSAAFNAANSSEWGSSYAAYQDNGGLLSAAEWKAGWESKYEQAYNATTQNAQAFNNANSSDGVIKGTFTTTESGNSSASSNSSSVEWANSAQAAAESKFGASWGAYQQGGGVAYETEAQWKAAYSAEYDSAYNNARAAAAFNTVSTVEVKGIGSIATVNAAETSNFNVSLVGGNGGDNAAGTATANGSAGANLSTSSYATQNSANTASAFIQAFN